MKAELTLQNLACDGCVDTILKKVENAVGVSNPKINVEKSTLEVECISYNALLGLEMSLAAIGILKKTHP